MGTWKIADMFVSMATDIQMPQNSSEFGHTSKNLEDMNLIFGA